MKLAMFGVTGTVGSALLKRVLDAGHDVHALVRSPAKLGAVLGQAEVTRGDACDESAVAAVVAGADAVLSTLGGARGPESLSRGTAAIRAAMREHEVRRLIVVQGFHLRFPGDPLNTGQRLIRPIMRTVYPAIVRHSEQMAADLQNCDLDWTVVRIPPVRTGKPLGDYRHGTLRLGPWSHARDVDVADFVLECLQSGGYLRQAPMLAGR